MTRSDKPVRARKKPVQARSKQTVEWLLAATARVFRAEGFEATTNRIAEAAGVSVGSLYEYFPNKDALLYALAERHVESAEAGVGAVLASDAATPEWLAGLQAAIVASHRYPSEALQRVVDARAPELRARAGQLVGRVREALLARCGCEIRSRTAFGLIGPLSSAAVYEVEGEDERRRVLERLCGLAVREVEGGG